MSDLISREALLKAIEEERQYLLARGQRGAEHILVHHCLPLIDNAPTVTPIDETFSTAVDKYGDNTFSVSVISSKGEKIDFERVKRGEWIDVHSELDYYATLSFTCGKCGCEHQLYSGEYGWYYDWYDDNNIPWNFCPKCGSKNVKGGETNE